MLRPVAYPFLFLSLLIFILLRRCRPVRILRSCFRLIWSHIGKSGQRRLLACIFGRYDWLWFDCCLNRAVLNIESSFFVGCSYCNYLRNLNIDYKRTN